MYACTSGSHSRFHQNVAKFKCLLVACGIELLQEMPMGICGIRCAMGLEFGSVSCVRACLMRPQLDVHTWLGVHSAVKSMDKRWIVSK